MRRSCRRESSGGATARCGSSAAIRSKISGFDQALGLEFAVAAADELLGRLVEVRQDVLDHPGGLAALERGGAHQVVDEVVIGRPAFEHPLILR